MTKSLRKRNIVYGLVTVCLLLLIAIRLYLPTWLTNHANQVLDDLPGYHGEVQNIDVHLFRGAYQVNGLKLYRTDSVTELPFLNVPLADISIQWGALFSGEIVSEIYLLEPVLNYVFEDHTVAGQKDAKVSDWTAALDELVPIDINVLDVSSGKLGLVQVSTDPPIDLYIDQITFQANNLQLIKKEHQALPSTLSASGVTVGGGKLAVNAKADLVRNIPDLDFNASIDNIDVTALNDLTLHYANIDFESGNLNLHTELAIHDGYLKGYFKPVLTDAKLIDKGDKFFEKIWESAVNVVKFIFKNHQKDNLATKIPLEGSLDNVEAGAWQTFVNILKNAFVEAFKDDIDKDIDFNDAKIAEDNK